jgi:recombination protein RecT
MSEIVSPKQKMANLRSLLMNEKVQAQIMSALPRHIDGKRLFRVYLTAVQTTPRILECDTVSVIGAVIQAAQVGLSLDSVFGEGFLIPRWNKNTNTFVAQFQTGYKGLRKLAFTSDKGIRDIYARVVYENDVFEYAYEPATLRHTPADADTRGPLKYAYAKVIWKEDNYDRFIVVGTPEINKAKGASDSAKKGFGPWIDNTEAMWAKTALRRLCDTLTLSADSDLARAMVSEDSEEAGRHAVAGLDLDFSSLSAASAAPQLQEPTTSALDQLAEQSGGQTPAPVQQRRRRAVQQEPVAAPTQPAAVQPVSPQHTQEEERIVGNIDRRTGEVIE